MIIQDTKLVEDWSHMVDLVFFFFFFLCFIPLPCTSPPAPRPPGATESSESSEIGTSRQMSEWTSERIPESWLCRRRRVSRAAAYSSAAAPLLASRLRTPPSLSHQVVVVVAPHYVADSHSAINQEQRRRYNRFNNATQHQPTRIRKEKSSGRESSNHIFQQKRKKLKKWSLCGTKHCDEV